MQKYFKLIPSVFVYAIIFVSMLSSTGMAVEPLVEARIFTSKKGQSMPYRILKPAHYNPNSQYPLVLCLHGAGGRGNDNRSRGTEAFMALSSAEVQARYPAFLLTPQCPLEKQWVNTPWQEGSYSISRVMMSGELKRVMEILDAVIKEFRIDLARIYVTGQSMGGYGTWDMILRYPYRFAAAVPVCGAGDPMKAKRIAHLPLWAFHGEKDTIVPTDGSRSMIQALRQAGSKAKYTEYQGVGHNCWSRSWKERNLIPWLFAQRNTGGHL